MDEQTAKMRDKTKIDEKFFIKSSWFERFIPSKNSIKNSKPEPILFKLFWCTVKNILAVNPIIKPSKIAAKVVKSIIFSCLNKYFFAIKQDIMTYLRQICVIYDKSRLVQGCLIETVKAKNLVYIIPNKLKLFRHKTCQ